MTGAPVPIQALFATRGVLKIQQMIQALLFGSSIENRANFKLIGLGYRRPAGRGRLLLVTITAGWLVTAAARLLTSAPAVVGVILLLLRFPAPFVAAATGWVVRRWFRLGTRTTNIFCLAILCRRGSRL